MVLTVELSLLGILSCAAWKFLEQCNVTVLLYVICMSSINFLADSSARGPQLCPPLACWIVEPMEEISFSMYHVIHLYCILS